jgi:hypothetical protein
MKISAGWFAAMTALLIPILTSIILLFSDVQTIKATKAEKKEVAEIRLEFSKQLVRNTTAIEALNDTLKELGRKLNNVE